ncbi:hypothetical protein F5Y09DRAFT_341576 [Xylaria sp. FL1042]|nr:hypothetical protein F5Y09DRAFT_341576 [Xylaria sp. FL1042]
MSHDQFHSLSSEIQQAILNGPAHVPPPGVLSNLGIFAVACAACGFRFVYGPGTFVHQWNVRVKDMFEDLYILHIGTNFYDVSIAALKVAILLEWARIFAPRGTRGLFYTMCHILLWMNVLFYASKILLINLACIPHRAIWDKTVPAKCLNQKIVYIVAAAVGVVSHVFILGLPQTIIWKLKMNTKKKIGVSVIFATGVLTTTAGIFRLIATAQLLVSSDVTYTISSVALWGLAELTLLILVYCLPAFPSIFRDVTLATVFSRVPRFWPKVFVKVSNTRRLTNISNKRTIAASSYQSSNESATRLNAPRHPSYISAGVGHFNDQPMDDMRNIIVSTHLKQREEEECDDTLQV